MLTVLSFGLVKSTTVQADNSRDVNFVLHKVLYEYEGRPASIDDHDGSASNKYDDYQKLNGVTFDVYDVTDEFYILIKNNSLEKTQAILANRGPENKSSIASRTTKYDSELGEDGVARFDGLSFYAKNNIDQKKLPKAYLFHESSRPPGVREKSQNLVVLLSDDIDLETIHLYPKAEILEEVPFEKVIVDEESSYEMGEEITFQINTEIPDHPEDYNFFIIRDRAMEGLKFLEDSLTVSINGDIKENIYVSKNRVNGFLLEFNLEALAEFASEDMTITYKMVLETDVTPDRGYQNYAELEYDNNILTDWEVVRTGGYKFLKVDRMEENITLANAHFVLKDSNGRYLHILKNRLEWRENRDTATIIESTEDGTFEVAGLKYGQYSLEEVKAPEGYFLSNTAVDFEIGAGTYSSGAVMNIINERQFRLPITGGEDQPELVPSTPGTPVVEKPVLKLPFTGFYNNMWFGILGLVFIASALVINLKVGKREEK